MSAPTFGIKQTIRLEWLIYTAALYQQGVTPAEIRMKLGDLLSEQRGTGNAGKRSDNTRDFVLANLMRIWVTPSDNLVQFRDAAATLLLTSSVAEAHAIHWGLTAATYPFWYHIARHTGRLLTLQGSITQKQLTTRLSEHYGETQTVSRYSQYVMRSFTAWDVIRDTSTQGNYSAGSIYAIDQPSVVAFLYESVLYAEQTSSKTLVSLQNDPSFFPYAMSYTAPQVLEQYNPRITTQRFGGQDDVVMLR